MEPKSEPRRDKKEKKSEVKLGELSEALEAKKRNERRSRVSSYEAAGGGKGRPRSPQDRPKTAPRPPQERPWEGFGAIFRPFQQQRAAKRSQSNKKQQREAKL